MNCAARWEVGSCCCPCVTDEESGALMRVAHGCVVIHHLSARSIPKCQLPLKADALSLSLVAEESLGSLQVTFVHLN